MDLKQTQNRTNTELGILQVNYDNHMLFREDKRQKGSPVRIFTNLPPEQIVLPQAEGYWYEQLFVFIHGY